MFAPVSLLVELGWTQTPQVNIRHGVKNAIRSASWEGLEAWK